MRFIRLAARLATAQIFFLFCLCVATSAKAADPNVSFDEKITLAGAELRMVGGGLMEGVGIYRRANKRVAFALYLTQRKPTPEEVLALAGPKRLVLKYQQEVDSEQVSRNLLNGIRNNVDRETRNKIANQLMKFGELFASIPVFQKGDIFNVDWIPASSTTVVTHNGKKIGEFPDKGFYDSLLLCFLGERPLDPKMKADFLDDK